MLQSIPRQKQSMGALETVQRMSAENPELSSIKHAGKRNVRVLFIQTQAENAGAQEIARLVATGLEQRGYVTRQLFFFRRTASFDKDETAEFCLLKRPSNPLALISLIGRLRKKVREFKPDVVLCFQHYGNLIGAPVAKAAGVRNVIANQNTSKLLTSKLIRILDLGLGVSGIFSRIVTVSSSAEADFTNYPQSYRSRLTRIDHGVAVKRSFMDRNAARLHFGLPNDAVILGCAARLHHMKQLDAAVRLLPQDPTWHLALAGQGPEAESLMKLAREFGCSNRLHLVGELDTTGVADFLAALDIFVFPSQAETFGLAAVEAAQAGVPVVANHLPVLDEVLSKDGEACAVFVDASDPVAFGKAVAALISSPAEMAMLSARGRRLSTRYPVESMVSAYEDLIQDLVSD
ncbi:glycosyltransferase family 4 protein [Microvirga soli]|uniref:glycosyltransferase family 4 protein n=1 Tax=Microvirga soli TaxID=1854496 RepID=UPI001FEAA632|nr:glycosyltransferase family 4 protein [Microvirga soli]